MSPGRESLVPASAGAPARRTALCLRCRTVFDEGTACDLCQVSTVVSLATRESRQELARGLRIGQRARRRDAWRTLGVTLPLVLLALPFGIVAPPAALVALLLLGAPATLSVIELVRSYSGPPRPPGVGLARLRLGGRGPIGHVIDGGRQVPSPLGAVPCVAAGVLLRLAGRPSSVLLTDATTVGFDVELPDGATVRIPAGRLRLDGPRAAVAPSPAQAARFLDAVDPLRAGDVDLFPFTLAQEITVRPGDRVAVLGILDAIEDEAARTSPHRSAVRRLLVPRGVPRVRVLAGR